MDRSLSTDPVARNILRSIDIRALLGRYGTVLALFALIIVASRLSPNFLRPLNLTNILSQVSIVGVIAIGMTFVILTAGIDLSVGATLALVAVVLAGVLERTGNIWLAIAAGMVVGPLVGLVNGLGVTLGRVQPFVMTLGMLGVARGFAFLYTHGEPIPVLDKRLLQFGIGYQFGLPNLSIVFLLLLVVAAFILRFTPFGRYVYAIGSNEEAARLSGVNVTLYKILVYVISGTTAAIAGVLYAVKLATAPATAGEGYELDAIAAVVVGGTSLFGGAGGVFGTFVGALIIGILNNILNLRNVSPFVQPLAKGVLVIAAVWIVGRGHRR